MVPCAFPASSILLKYSGAFFSEKNTGKVLLGETRGFFYDRNGLPLVNTGEKLKAYLKDNKTLHEVKDVDEAPFVAFEAEFAKLRDYIAGLEEGKRDKALAVLDLLHEFIDDIHQFVDGHAHEEAAK